jgi:hypothetical protein
MGWPRRLPEATLRHSPGDVEEAFAHPWDLRGICNRVQFRSPWLCNRIMPQDERSKCELVHMACKTPRPDGAASAMKLPTWSPHKGDQGGGWIAAPADTGGEGTQKGCSRKGFGPIICLEIEFPRDSQAGCFRRHQTIDNPPYRSTKAARLGGAAKSTSHEQGARRVAASQQATRCAARRRDFVSIISERRKSKAETQPTVSKTQPTRQRPIEVALLQGRLLRVKAAELPRRRFLHLAAGAAAQAHPTRPVRFIVPSPPGGSTDPAARFIAESMSRSLASGSMSRTGRAPTESSESRPRPGARRTATLSSLLPTS